LIGEIVALIIIWEIGKWSLKRILEELEKNKKMM